MTQLFVTHDVNEALTHASRVLALREGAIVFDGPSGALTTYTPRSGETVLPSRSAPIRICVPVGLTAH